MRVVSYVRTRWPFFNASGGVDHAVVLPGERGACWVEPREEVEPLIKVRRGAGSHVHVGGGHMLHAPGNFITMLRFSMLPLLGVALSARL